MTNYTKDVLIGFMFIIGTWGFISGWFVISAIVFAFATVLSKINLKTTRKTMQHSESQAA